MTPRSIRRAAEHKARKKAAKAARLNPIPNEAATASQDDNGSESNIPSAAQFAANHANAQLSTGPTSAEGKAISSRNHTTHGLAAIPCFNFKVLPGEDQTVYDSLLATYRREWNPDTATEHDLVTRLATHAWLRDRAIRLQDQILCSVGEQIAVEQRKDIALYLRYYNTHARAYSKALAEIQRLRNFQMNQRKSEAILERRALEAQIRFESQKQKAELHTAKLDTIRLKQEVLKQRNQPSTAPTLRSETAREAASSSS